MKHSNKPTGHLVKARETGFYWVIFDYMLFNEYQRGNLERGVTESRGWEIAYHDSNTKSWERIGTFKIFKDEWFIKIDENQIIRK